MSDIKQTKQWARYLSQIGWKVVKINKNYLYIKRLPIGSYIRIPRPSQPVNFEKIDKIAHENNAMLVKITPKITIDSKNADLIDKKLLTAGYKKDFWTNTVSKTMILDLTQSKKNILKSFHTKTRQYINLAQRKGVKIKALDNINLAYKIYLETAKRHNFKPESYQSVKTRYEQFKRFGQALLLFAYFQSEPLCALLILFNAGNREAVGSLAATSDKFRDLNAYRLLVWEAMLRSKRLGVKKLDFDGISDSRFKNFKIWEGATFFKKGFGGREVTYLGSYIKSYNPLTSGLLYLISRL